MAPPVSILLKSALFTTGAFAVGQLLRVVTNVVLARLLAPEVFGIMLIIFSLKVGIELVSDLGVGQSMVTNENAEDPEFYNTAWTLQLVRSVLLWIAFSIVAIPAADFYHLPILAYVIPASSITFLFMGLTSIRSNLIHRQMRFRRSTAVDTTLGIIGSFANILMAFLSPTIWGLVLAQIFSSALGTVLSYFTLPSVKQKLFISKKYVMEIVHFGKWMFVSSVAYFLAMNFDRLYLAKALPLEVVGVYGIARAMSELASTLFMRLGNNNLFPFIASHARVPRGELRQKLGSMRAKILLLVACGFSIIVTTGDLVIQVLYDQRYQAARWMVPVLLAGSWFSILTNLNEATILGLGKPVYSALCNFSKFALLLVGLPLCLSFFGLVGGVALIAAADLGRYFPILIGQIRENLSFGKQDLALTLLGFSLIVLLELLRWSIGFGTSFDALSG